MTRVEQHLLVRFHMICYNTTIVEDYSQSANKVEELVTLEGKYGPLVGHKPVIDTIMEYLEQV